jgi:biotin synthase-related radical SAM superfamily protein
VRYMVSPETVRLSLAAAITLGFKTGKFYRGAKLGCINLLMEYDEGCMANCRYCGQAKEISDSPDCKSLIRVSWPSYPLVDVIRATKEASERDPFVQRVCVSALTRPEAPRDLVEIVSRVKAGTDVRISTLITPTVFTKEDFKAIKEAGAENITVAVDCSTKEIFTELRGDGSDGPHAWERYLQGVREAVEVMGKGPNSVGVHLIIGLGETEEQAVGFIQGCYDIGARVHLFSFYPEKGSLMEDGQQPPLPKYRRVQLARWLIDKGLARGDRMTFKDGGVVDFGVPREVVDREIRGGKAFITSGCPGCNRPFANETPTQAMEGLLRNYPFQPDKDDIRLIEGQFWAL